MTGRPKASEVAGRIAERTGAREALLKRLVDVPSGSRHRAGVARVVDLLARELDAIGLRVSVHSDAEGPRHVTARLGPADAAARVLLVGHCDTVFPATDNRQLTMDADRFYGPGATDMKGGLVIALDALRAIKRELLASSLAVDVVINGDEELGSPHSRDLIREHARGARFALVFENAPTDSAVIVGRRGLGRARVEITGKAAHAGINPEQGASAVIEAAHKVIAISRYHDPQGGLGVVVGLMSGGRSRNTVPPNAELAIDLRYVDQARAESVLESLRGIGEAQTVPGTTSRFTGELHRPPMLAVSPHQRVALASAQDAADALQLGSLDALETGGGSDANLTADLGVPSIDGLGVVGGAIHTDREWGLRASLGSRTALTAELLLQLGVAGL